jgi:hypothetical protein
MDREWKRWVETWNRLALGLDVGDEPLPVTYSRPKRSSLSTSNWPVPSVIRRTPVIGSANAGA